MENTNLKEVLDVLDEKRGNKPFLRIEVIVKRVEPTWLLVEDTYHQVGFKPCLFLVVSKRGLTEGMEVGEMYTLTLNCSTAVDRKLDKFIVKYWLVSWK